jgi:hypothetical protein
MRRQQHTYLATPLFRRFWLRPALCGTTRGLTQAPRFAIYWKWKGVGTLLSTYRPLWTDSLPPQPWRAAYGGTVGPRGSPMGLRMQPRSEKFFTLISKAGPNVVESAAGGRGSSPAAPSRPSPRSPPKAFWPSSCAPAPYSGGTGASWHRYLTTNPGTRVHSGPRGRGTGQT